MTPCLRIYRNVLFITIAGAAMSCAPAFAAAPMANTSAPGFFRIMLGDFEITALSDGTADVPINQLMKSPPAKVDAALARSFLKSPLETSFNAFLVNTGSKLVMIDAGAGGLYGPTLGKLQANLKASGYQPEQVDEIYITHLHPDHIGGVLAGAAIAFPNAVVRADRREADYWLSKANVDAAPAATKPFFDGATSSLAPYIAAKRFQPFDGATDLVPGVQASPSYGHTPGHTVYVVQSKGQKLVLIGDLIHVGAMQFDDPAETIAFDTDNKAALARRLKVFAALAKEGALVGSAHVQFPGLGHLRATGKSYRWIPVNYTQLR